MFRKPRESISSLADIAPQAPSTGRPPTPPKSQRRQHPAAYRDSPKMAVPTTPLLGRSKTAPKPTPRIASAGKAKSNGNGNILNFFSKSVPPKSEAAVKGEESLFLDDDDFGTGPAFGKVVKAVQTPTPPKEGGIGGQSPELDARGSPVHAVSRYNEDDEPVKRRKIYNRKEKNTADVNGGTERWRRASIADGYDSDGLTIEQRGRAEVIGDWMSEHELQSRDELLEEVLPEDMTGCNRRQIYDPAPIIPSLKQESTSFAEPNDFEGIEDFIDDEFPEEGEEYLERKWMQEQAELEMGLEEDDTTPDTDGTVKHEETDVDTRIVMHNEEATSCPLCSASLAGITDQVCVSTILTAIQNLTHLRKPLYMSMRA